ncbi:MAG: N-acetylglucosamine-6-phosphate deacetylase [Acutalibacter sp.]|jgi:N-acetylglucosamine-6-phosphate deacetylase|uniref:N-acetylglucosamine-6-phosphate deacetylase n=1 Tax=Acutalibacter sp. TaxID=1918636 RepID=UPI00217084F5|nr:N-acetylglucosamine-6-phosphate deacetylase [Acutalibacter sp.]MCI9224065.1 N-acetylglucosamine-6-phosphate deacetylase [Acutalibacter sp.]
MFIINSTYLDKDFNLVKGNIQIENGRITACGSSLPRSDGDTAIDAQGYTVVPGFVDVHIHGCAGADAGDGTTDSIESMGRFLLSHGVTSFCPTTATVSSDTIKAAIRAAKQIHEHPIKDGAKVAGMNLEGPFFSRERKGAQNEEFLLAPDFELFKEWYDLSGGLVKLIDLATEQPGGEDFVKRAKELCTVSIAHTTASYEDAKDAFDWGVTHVTHLFNAMNGLHHRKPGVVGAALEDERVRAELICDGEHIHPAVLRVAFNVLGDRALIVSDSLRANGMPEGAEYDLGGQTVRISGGKCVLPDGTIAGSVSNLHQEVKNLVSWGVPLPRAVKSASLIPAIQIGADKEIGSIEPGKAADLVILDKDLEIASVWISHGTDTHCAVKKA